MLSNLSETLHSQRKSKNNQRVKIEVTVLYSDLPT